jgi:hypothetical protein
MPLQIVPDRSGDTRYQFDASNPLEVTDAERRFNELIALGRAAIALGENGAPGKIIKAFDSTVERTLFQPNLQGG